MTQTVPTRHPERASSDRAALDDLLDSSRVCHIALTDEGEPMVFPTGMGRLGDRLLVHGSTGSRWMRLLAGGALASVAVTALDALVVSRSAFESSMRYRSAILFGSFAVVDDADDRLRCLDALTDSLIPGRVAEVRRPTAKELAATLVLALPITTWSLKVSAGWPDDPPDDVAGDAWAGVVPLELTAGTPRPAPDLRSGIPLPASVRAICPPSAELSGD